MIALFLMDNFNPERRFNVFSIIDLYKQILLLCFYNSKLRYISLEKNVKIRQSNS